MKKRHPKLMNIRMCRNCAEEFQPLSGNHWVCSDECHEERTLENARARHHARKADDPAWYRKRLDRAGLLRKIRRSNDPAWREKVNGALRLWGRHKYANDPTWRENICKRTGHLQRFKTRTDPIFVEKNRKRSAIRNERRSDIVAELGIVTMEDVLGNGKNWHQRQSDVIAIVKELGILTIGEMK